MIKNSNKLILLILFFLIVSACSSNDSSGPALVEISSDEEDLNSEKGLEENDDEETLFIYPEGILTNIYLEDLFLYKKTFKENFSKNHKIILGINSLQNGEIYNSLVLLDNELNILDQYN